MRLPIIGRPLAGSIHCILVPDPLHTCRHRPPGRKSPLVQTQLLQLRFRPWKLTDRLLLVVAILTAMEVRFIPDGPITVLKWDRWNVTRHSFKYRFRLYLLIYSKYAKYEKSYEVLSKEITPKDIKRESRQIQSTQRRQPLLLCGKNISLLPSFGRGMTPASALRLGRGLPDRPWLLGVSEAGRWRG